MYKFWFLKVGRSCWWRWEET